MQKPNFIESRIALVELRSNNFVYVQHKDIQPFPAVDEIKELVTHILELANGKPFVALVDYRDMFQNWDTEAKEYVANHKELNDLQEAVAIVVNTLPIKLVVKLYISFFKPPNETKIFNNLDGAEKWLQKKIDKLLN